MKYPLKSALLMLTALVMLGCGSDNAPTEPPVAQEQTLVSFSIVEHGKVSGISVDKPTLFVIDNEADFKDFWAKHSQASPDAPMPNQDLSTHTLIAIVDADQPNGGYYLTLDKIEQMGDELWVHVTRQQPATSCVNMGMIAQPFAIVSVNKTSLKPKLVFQTQQYPC